jgi:ADP-ribose pyrophosphatase YjhB (NUDIX family)
MPTPTFIRELRAKIGHDLIMMTTVAAVIRTMSDEIVLHRRSDNGIWSLPGGSIEPGEEPAEAVMREAFEETGLQVAPRRIVGVYGGPSHVGEYPNGDKFAIINLTFACDIVGGEIQANNDESLDVAYFPLSALPESLDARHRIRIEHAVTRTTPYFKFPV